MRPRCNEITTENLKAYAQWIEPSFKYRGNSVIWNFYNPGAKEYIQSLKDLRT